MNAVSLCRTLLLIAGALSLSTAQAATLYVAPGGNDAWSGTLVAPNAEATDGPLATIAGARDAIRKLEAAAPLAGPVQVLVGEGEYALTEPVVFGPEDSGTAEAPVSYEAAPGTNPVIHGGRAITGWRQEGALWVADIPAVLDGSWAFSQLFVNGERRTPARTPNATNPAGDFPEPSDLFYTVGPVMEKNATTGEETKSTTRFYYKPEDLKAWASLQDAIVVVYHSWETALLRPKSIDEVNHIIEFTGPTNWGFGYWHPDQRYYIEHLFEGLDQPGEWFLNKKEGRLYYMPMPNETLETVKAYAPVAGQLIRIDGKPAEGQFVSNLTFRGLKFYYTEFKVKPEGHSDGQAAASVPAAIEATGARNVIFDQCEMGHLGTYGLWFRAGSQDNQLNHSEVYDLGAGAVRIGEGGSPATENEATLRNVVDNSFLHDGGRVFRGAVGVWIGRSSFNRLSHNEICDFRYTGISVGWSWGYDESSAHDNIIEFNNVHDIAKGQLSDTGGIYTLGVSPGTVIRNNIFHDILSSPKVSGGWGIYFDEGSTGILAENNLVYNTLTGTLHQHYGQDNRVVNNIFAFSHNGQLIRSREEEHNSFFFEGNIVYYNNNSLLGSTWKNGNFKLDRNIYWTTMPDIVELGEMDFAGRSWNEWHAEGHDVNSVIMNPGFENAEAGDFRLKADSPALAYGFKPFDFSQAGLYGDPAWVEKPRKIERKPFTPPPLPASYAVSDGFESTPVGNLAAGVHSSEEGEGKVRVTDEQAATGKQSLKFSDAPGLSAPYNPHVYYTPGYRTGVVKASFAIRLDAGAVFYHEWRDSKSPYQVGPSLWFNKGQLIVGGNVLATLPEAQWVLVNITCKVGRGADGTYELGLVVPGLPPQSFTRLPCASPEFRRLDWLGFVSSATEANEAYVDDVKLSVE